MDGFVRLSVGLFVCRSVCLPLPFSPRLRLPVYLSLSVSPPGMTRLKMTPVIDVRAADRDRFSLPGHSFSVLDLGART